MNAAHAHLIVNHLPVLGVPFGIFVVLYGIWRKSDEVKRLGLLIFALTALAAGAVYLSGSFAREQVERLPGISEGLVENHQDAAEISVIAASVQGVVALVALVLYKKKPRAARDLLWTSLLLAVIVSGLFAWTANLGGQIHHPEIRSER